MPKRLTLEEAKANLALFAECQGDCKETARRLGINRATWIQRLSTYRARYPDMDIPETVNNEQFREIPEEELLACLNAFAIHGEFRKAARAIGMNEATFRRRIEMAETKGIVATFRGSDEALQPVILELPEKGKVKRYILSTAQNDTLVYEPAWNALRALSKHYGAEILVGTLTYMTGRHGSQKRGQDGGGKSMSYDSRLEPFIRDDMLQLAPSLVWNGHTNILPTAVDPLSGWENYNFRSSSIFPHVKIAMKSIPTVRQDAAKLQFTTGAVTKRNYIQKKTGQRAEFDHVYGGLIVEVDHEGSWWCRQLNVDPTGTLYDLDLIVTPDGRVKKHKGIEALQFGDIHVAQLEDDMRKLTWGKGGMVDDLKPSFQFMHDILDFESRSHHNLRDPFKMFELYTQGRDSVQKEIKGVGDLLVESQRDYCQTVIVQSNHDRHFEKWLRETDWKKDPLNAVAHAKATVAFLESIRQGESFNALRWALVEYNPVEDIEWADPDEGYLILKGYSGGIEMGLHGDLGPHAVRGSLRNLSRLGRKVCIGHSHSPGIFNGAYQSGVKAKLAMDYAKGSPSSWSQTDIVVHRNSKRQLVTWWKKQYRAVGEPQKVKQ